MVQHICGQGSAISAQRAALNAQRSTMVQPWRHHGCKRALLITYIPSRFIAHAVIIAGKWMDGRAYLKLRLRHGCATIANTYTPVGRS
jgi:hypothetical protein